MKNKKYLAFFASICCLSFLLSFTPGRALVYASNGHAASDSDQILTDNGYEYTEEAAAADDVYTEAAGYTAADASYSEEAECTEDVDHAVNTASAEENSAEDTDYAENAPLSIFPGDTPGYCGVLDDGDHFTGNLTYTLSDGTLAIQGEGEMGEMMHRQPWEDEAENIRNIVIGKGVTYISFGAFRYLPNLTSVTIPSTVERIGSFAFQDCKNLKEVHIEAGVVGEAAFIHCTGLEKVFIGNGVTAIGVSAFENCPRINGVYINDVAAWCRIYFGGYNSNPLEQNRDGGRNHIYLNGQEIIHLDIPEGVTRIGDYAFHCAKNIRSVHIPSSVTEIGEYAFFQNEALQRVTGASSLVRIGMQAFEGDISLSEMPFPSGLEHIGAYAFRYAPLASVTMQRGEIGKYAFDGCGNLTSLNIGEGVRIGENAFRHCPASVPSNVSYERKTGRMGRWGGLNLYWIVLEEKDGKALVLSRDIIEFLKFHKYTSPAESGYEWGNSYLREWLNGNFYRSAFSDKEKQDIFASAAYNDDNQVFGTKDGGSSFGRLFILSASELERYLPDSEDRMASRMPHAQAINPNTGTNDSAEEHPYLNTSYYWVRTPGLFDYSQCYVHYTGKIMYDGQSKSNWIVGVRPAMWINEDALDMRGPEGLVNDFVVRLYRYCLDREPDQKGLEEWLSALESGKYTAAQVVKSFFMSKEMKNRNLDEVEFLETCYLVMMDRNADSIGLGSWSRVLDSGISRLYVVKQFVNSQEFSRICDAYGVEKGTVTVTEPRDQNYWVTSFVSRCYKEVLERNADADGINAWTSAILNASNRREEAVKTLKKGFFHSEEFLSRRLSDSEYCMVLYRVFFERLPDDSGMTSWMDALAKGTDRDKVLEKFATSQEFSSILDRYGL